MILFHTETVNLKCIASNFWGNKKFKHMYFLRKNAEKIAFIRRKELFRLNLSFSFLIDQLTFFKFPDEVLFVSMLFLLTRP